MPSRFLVATCIAALATGCNDVGDGTTILGITPAMQAEIRDLMADANPEGDADKQINEYIDRLRTLAHDVGAKQGANGDYALTGETQESWKAFQNDPDALLTEFAMEPPAWLRPLYKDYEIGTIEKGQKELLLRAMFVELMAQLAG